MSWEIRQGDCVEVMAAMPDGSVDAVVCDPPYSLGFMSKPWDMQVDHTRWSVEALRVLKPGGHLLAFGGTRTYHRLACAVEDAGFEIRDTIAWMYGSGFPKSLDVSKAIDRQRDDGAAIRAVTAFITVHRNGKSNRDIDAHFGFNGMAGHWTTQGDQAAVPTVAQWAELKGLLGLPDDMDAEVWRLNGRKGQPGENWEKREKVGEADLPVGHAFAGPTYGGDSSSQLVDLTAPATPEAQQWQGWGTALKPAWESVVVARKPLQGTVAQNVLEHGTGALNVDATRIDSDGSHMVKGTVTKRTTVTGDTREGKALGMYGAGASFEPTNHEGGRWPANVVLDERAAELLDEQTGELGKSAGTQKADRGAYGDDKVYGQGNGLGVDGPVGFGDSGGASRFFYVAKASRAERNAGLKEAECSGDGSVDDAGNRGVTEPPKPALSGETVTHERPLANSGLRKRQCNVCGSRSSPQYHGGPEPACGHDDWSYVWYVAEGRRYKNVRSRINSHPTVKPIELMRWLVRLVTPPGGTCLDPFAGSGTTGIAAVLEGFDFIGIEREPEYVAIAEARIGWWHKHRGDGEAQRILEAGAERDLREQDGQGSLFA